MFINCIYVNKVGVVVLYIIDLYFLKKDIKKSDYVFLMFFIKVYVLYCYDLNYGCLRII